MATLAPSTLIRSALVLAALAGPGLRAAGTGAGPASALPARPGETEYRPGGKRFAKAWSAFYAGGQPLEPALPLVRAGKRMVPALSDAVLHPDMRLRRHAISALGTLGDARALPVLAGILRGEQEQPVFRGDALVAIYQIDRQAGLRLARKYQGRFPHVEDAIEIIGQMEAGTWRWTPGQEPRGWQRQARPGPA